MMWQKYLEYWGIFAVQRPRMIFSGCSTIVLSPEWLQVSPHPPLSSCSSSGDGRKIRVKNGYHGSNWRWSSTHAHNQRYNKQLRMLSDTYGEDGVKEWETSKIEILFQVSSSPHHQSHQAGAQHMPNIEPVGWWTHKEWRFFPRFSQTRSKTRTTDSSSKVTALQLNHRCYQPSRCPVRNMNFRGQDFQPDIFASTELTWFFFPIKSLILKYRPASARRHMLPTIIREHMEEKRIAYGCMGNCTDEVLPSSSRRDV